MEKQNQQSPEQTQNIPEKKKWYKKWWVIVIGIVILYAIGSNAVNNTNKKVAEDQQAQNTQVPSQEATNGSANQNTQTTQPTEPEKVVPQISVTSASISKEYSENEVAADAKYKGKLIEISGKIAGVNNGITDNEMIVRLSDGQYDVNDPYCYMKASEHDKVLTFKKGQQITLVGTGDSATIGSPVLKDCTVK